MSREPGLNPNIPASSRIWDYVLGSKDSYDVDRGAAYRMLAIAPDTRLLAQLCHQFLLRSVRSVAESGIRQFIDLGAGFPTFPDVGDLAREIDKTARVAYVDNDPIVHAHCDAFLTGWPGATALKADIRCPHDVIDQIKISSTIDFNDPVAVLMTQVLDYVSPEEQPEEIVRAFLEVMAPGSYLVITHATDDSNEDLRHQMIADTMSSPAQPTFRSRAQIETLLKGFDPIGPGLVPVQNALGPELPITRLVMLSAVCRLAS
ncbi:SAM-dependent methyltransferase [Nocardia sp. CA-128927]|uniref:SAM-dependent methyltransferase n=1 Tax=Nocardia sp. CA-128927 TaxID=3239975 RepID=UPI003D97DB03